MTASRAASEMKKEKLPRPKPAPLAYRPADAASVLGVSRSTIYQMIADGEIEARKLGTATLIRHEELARVLAGTELAPATKLAQASIK